MEIYHLFIPHPLHFGKRTSKAKEPMSIDTTVYLSHARLPTAAKWQFAVKVTGLALELESGFDPERSSGWTSCFFETRTCGFYYRLDLLEPGVTIDGEPIVADYDRAVTFSTISGLDNLAAATVAGATLARITGGTLVNMNHPPQLDGEAAMEWCEQTLGIIRRRAHGAAEAASYRGDRINAAVACMAQLHRLGGEKLLGTAMFTQTRDLVLLFSEDRFVQLCAWEFTDPNRPTVDTRMAQEVLFDVGQRLQTQRSAYQVKKVLTLPSHHLAVRFRNGAVLRSRDAACSWRVAAEHLLYERGVAGVEVRPGK